MAAIYTAVHILQGMFTPLTGSNTWVDLEGTGFCRKLWDGAEVNWITDQTKLSDEAR